MKDFNIPSSGKSVRKTFDYDLSQHFVSAQPWGEILSEADIYHLPEPVRNYLDHCGFIGHTRIVNAQVVWNDSFIKMKPKGKWMKLLTLQYNSTISPFRIAYMKAKMGGIIPFEGRDIYASGKGHMFGKIATLIKVFDEKSHHIAQGALVTILAEALLVPGYALSDYTTWEAINQNSAKATISHEGLEVSGIFYFNEAHEMIRFESSQRYFMDPEKGFVLTPFIAEVGGFKRQGDLLIPTTLTASWQLENEKYQYWKGTIKEVNYNISV